MNRESELQAHIEVLKKAVQDQETLIDALYRDKERVGVTLKREAPATFRKF